MACSFQKQKGQALLFPSCSPEATRTKVPLNDNGNCSVRLKNIFRSFRRLTFMAIQVRDN